MVVASAVREEDPPPVLCVSPSLTAFHFLTSNIFFGFDDDDDADAAAAGAGCSVSIFVCASASSAFTAESEGGRPDIGEKERKGKEGNSRSTMGW